MNSEMSSMYENIDYKNNQICQECRSTVEGLSCPHTLWHIGKQPLHNGNKKLLFVGKNARGMGEINSKSGFYDATSTGQYLFENSSWAYWSYTREIAKKIYPSEENAWDLVSFTNIVKCNNSDSADTTPSIVKENCILKLQIVLKEISLIEPTHIVFYLDSTYDSYVEKLFNITLSNDTRTVGEKSILWSDFEVEINGKLIRCLRTSHPERKKKLDFINVITDWIDNS